MRWRTPEEIPRYEEDCLLKLKEYEVCVVAVYHDGKWYEEYTYTADDVEKWCPLDEIIEAIDKGDSSDDLAQHSVRRQAVAHE